MTEKYFKRESIQYVKHDITENEMAYEFVVGLGYQQVPVVVAPFQYEGVGHWSGFRPDKLAQLKG